jgi:hypothetical protein
MQKIMYVIALALCVTGCDALERNTERLASDIGLGYDKTRYKISDYIYSREQAPPVAQLPEPQPNQAYCYRLLADTVCYEQPVAYLSTTLIASQSGNSYTPVSSPEPSSPTEQAASHSEPVTVHDAPSIAAITSTDATSAPMQLMSGF